MSRAGIEQLLRLLDRAFAANVEHALLANLRDVDDALWRLVPPGGTRSIADIVAHVGQCKYMYDNHAFGDRSLTWDEGPVAVPSTRASTIDWLWQGQRRLVDSVSALDDDELVRPRMTNWGEEMETREIIETMIAHDLYHAGEINHVRALLQSDDRWAHDKAQE